MNLYLIDRKRRRVVGLEGFEPPTHGLGNLVPLLSGFENFILYYIRQRVTNPMILGRVLVLTRFEQITTTVLLQSRVFKVRWKLRVKISGVRPAKEWVILASRSKRTLNEINKEESFHGCLCVS
jgi:hypothetical protein